MVKLYQQRSTLSLIHANIGKAMPMMVEHGAKVRRAVTYSSTISTRNITVDIKTAIWNTMFNNYAINFDELVLELQWLN